MRRRPQTSTRANRKLIVLGVVGLIVLGSLVWTFRPGYRTLYKGTASLDPFQENYVYEPVKVDSPDARFKIVVEAYGERTLSAYLFTPKEFENYANVRDGRGGDPDSIDPLWSAQDVASHSETDIQLDYTGKLVFVVCNERWNQLGVSYEIAMKGE